MRHLIATATFSALCTLGLYTHADELVHMPAPGALADMPFSEAVIYDDLIFLSGQLGVDPQTATLVEGGIGPETRQTLENIRGTLERAGVTMDEVIKCTVYLADMDEWPAMNAEYVKFFNKKPARSALGTGGSLALGGRVEIECIAAAPEDDDTE